MPFALAGCLAFQDVELSTDREGNACSEAMEGTLFCAKKVLGQCVDGTWTQKAVCPRECLNGHGCVDCKPKTRRCDGNVVYECNDLGTEAVLDDCSTKGQVCNLDTLTCGACAKSREAHCDGADLQVCNDKGSFNQQLCGTFPCVTVDGLSDHCAECETVGRRICTPVGIKECSTLLEFEPADPCDCTSNEDGDGVCK